MNEDEARIMALRQLLKLSIAMFAAHNSRFSPDDIGLAMKVAIDKYITESPPLGLDHQRVIDLSEEELNLALPPEVDLSQILRPRPE